MRINVCAECQRTLGPPTVTPNMKLFSNIRKRTTASVALLVWLFALASGVANACSLDAREASAEFASSAGSSASTSASAVSARHSEPSAGHNEDSENSKALCLKACDDGSNSLPSQSSAIDLNDPHAATVFAVVWQESTQFASKSGRMLGLRSPLSGPPVRTRFPRLTI